MEKLNKDLFTDKTLAKHKKVYAGWCITSIGGTVTHCGGGLSDVGQ